MLKRTFVIIDTDGRYYRSFFEPFFAITHSRVLVNDTKELEKARKFRTLWWATYRAKYLSKNASPGYYYVYEWIKNTDGKSMMIMRNEQVIDKIKQKDADTLEKIQQIIDDWRKRRGLDK